MLHMWLSTVAQGKLRGGQGHTFVSPCSHEQVTWQEVKVGWTFCGLWSILTFTVGLHTQQALWRHGKASWKCFPGRCWARAQHFSTVYLHQGRTCLNSQGSMTAHSNGPRSCWRHPLCQRAAITNTGLIWEISKDTPLPWTNILATFMWCFMGKILFHCLALTSSLLPPVTASPLAPWWTPGSRVEFPPSLTSWTLPFLSALPGCTNPEHPSCEVWLTFSRGLLNVLLLALWGGGNGNPRKAVTPGKR